MKTQYELPSGYSEILTVDLQKNKKQATIINIAALVIGLAMGIGMHFYIPITTLFNMSDGFVPYLIRFAALLVGMVAYIILHEAVHGIAMKMFGARKVKYGFTGIYAYAGSDDYFGKTPYIVIALAPIVVWGIVLAVLNFIVPVEFFWVVYFIQISNISGAAGDLYVTFKFLRLPKDILVCDTGVSMTVYSSGSKES